MSKGFDFSCCGQPMRCLGLVDFLAPEIESIRRLLCPVCGHGVDLVHFDLDAAELRNEIELYGDEQSPLHIQHLKGGNWNMANETNNKDTATLVPTKAGRGYKVVVDGVWFYTAKEHLQDVVNGKAKACTFSTIKDDEVVAK